MKKASELVDKRGRVTLAFGPVGTGKTCLIASQPTPHLILACDTGNVTIPPGVHRDEVFIEEFHIPTRKFGPLGNTVPIQDIYTKTIKRLHEIYTAISTGGTLLDDTGHALPPLSSISLDGVYRLNQMLVDGQCVLNNVNEPGDMGKKKRKLWGSRLLSIMTIFNQFAGLSINVGFTTWEDPERDKEGNFTGRIYPAIGGKMDVVGAGLADAVLYCYIRGGKYMVRTKSDGMIQGCKVRNNFTIADTVDVTIDPSNGKLPWEKVWE